MAKKQTAHRPSQANQEYVTMSDGRKVRNTAYKPKQTSGMSHENITNSISNEMSAGASSPASMMSTSERAEASLENLDNIVATFEEGGTPTADQANDLQSFAERIHGLKESGKSAEFDDLVDSYGIDSIETESSVRDTMATGDVLTHRATINGGDKNLPRTIMTEVTGPNKYHPNNTVTKTTVLFDGNNDTDVTSMVVTSGMGDNSTTVALKDKRGRGTSHTFHENGDTEYREGSALHGQVIQPGSKRGVGLTMWRDNDPMTLDTISNVQSIHKAGLAKGKPVTYGYSHDLTTIVASWEEDGEPMYCNYEIKGKGDRQRAVPGMKYRDRTR